MLPMAEDSYVRPKVYKDMEAAARVSAGKHLNRLVAKAQQAGVRVKGLLLEGIPHEPIARAARSKKTDLVVIGTHGRTGLAKFFLGSVAGHVVAVAPCPVLTVSGK
jgi:nucleotide-binding universal stress UspA family protein